MEQLLHFFEAAGNDCRIGTAHISVYLALFSLRYANAGHDPVSFSRPEVMRSAKISGRATYHKCMKDLHDYGYIKYVPSHHPVLGSIAFLGQQDFAA